MSDRPDDSSTKPTYPDLPPPGEFVSDIPQHLLENASPADRFVMEQLSIARQSNAWCVQVLLRTHSEVVHTNGRVRKAEAEIADLKDDKRSITRGWRFIVAAAGIISGVVSFLVLLYQAFNGGAH